MITKYYEISCDGCGGGDYFPGTKEQSIEHFKDVGWIFKGDKQYCDKDCSLKSPEVQK